MKYKCNNCRKTFKEPKVKHTTYESYYGVSSYDVGSFTPLKLDVCPYCNNDDIEEVDEIQELYQRLCVGCEYERFCHEECVVCEKYEEALEELENE